MARIGISITKTTPFRNSTQDFSNVYYYEDALGGLPSAAAATTLINELVTFEKTVHATVVTFKVGRLWSQGATPAASDMIQQANLSGGGSLAGDASLDRERAFLFKLRAGNDSRGQPVFLRKWYHSCGAFPGVGGSLNTQILANLSGFNQTQRDNMVTNMQTIGAIGGGTEPWKLCSKTGRSPTAGAGWVCHPFLEHHQLGDMWRSI